MTDEIYSRDAYQATAEARVVEIRDEGVVLDRTVFYARGGGQPGDTGMLRWDGGEAQVADTVKQAGEVLHALADGETPPAPGTTVTAVAMLPDLLRGSLMGRYHDARPPIRVRLAGIGAIRT